MLHEELNTLRGDGWLFILKSPLFLSTSKCLHINGTAVQGTPPTGSIRLGLKVPNLGLTIPKEANK